jgi:tetratricopeptide (TPR) repeat protein
VRNAFFRQGLAEFARVCEVAPDNLPARLWLAQLYDFNHLPDRALAVIQDIRRQPEKFPLDDDSKMQLAIVGTAAYFQKEDLTRGTQLLEAEISRSPTNDVLLNTAIQFYTAKGLFTNALAAIDSRLQYSPDDAGWLFRQSLVYLQLKDYDPAIAALSRVLSQQANNSTARFNRAIAYLNSGKLDDARADYETLGQTYTNSFRIDYGLGEIAWRQHATNDAIKYYKLYLANANTNTAEATNVIQRLRQLGGKSP